MTTETLVCLEHEQFFKSAAGQAAHNRIKHPPPAVTDPDPEPEPAAEPERVVQRNQAGRAIPETIRTDPLTLADYGVSMPRALLRSWWIFMLWLLGPLFAAATFQVLPANMLAAVVGICLLLPLPLFLAIWSRRLMPVLRLELNETGDRYQLRVYYAFKGDHGAEGRHKVFGTKGYAIDGLESTDRALDVSHISTEYKTTTPEALRYLCDHTPSREKYRRKATRLAREIIQWGSIIALVGILAGLTFIIGNTILTEPPA